MHPGSLPQLGSIYPKAKFWVFARGPFCVSGTVTWVHADEDKNIVLGNGFAGAFDCIASLFDGERAEFDVAGGRLSLYLTLGVG
jgi:hypothetical protein